MSVPSPRRLLAIVAGLLVVALGATGCSPEYTSFDPGHSSNLIVVSPEFPGEEPEEYLTEQELGVYREYGRPDVIRLLFNRAGDIYSPTTAQHEYYIRGNSHEGIERAWIYRSRNLEIRITALGVEHRELSDKVRTLIEYGDPNGTNDLGSGREKWVYYDFGRRFTFDGDKLLNEERFQPMGWRRHPG